MIRVSPLDFQGRLPENHNFRITPSSLKIISFKVGGGLLHSTTYDTYNKLSEIVANDNLYKFILHSKF